MGTLRETIADLTKEHLGGGGLLYGQCLSAVGFVAGTIPKDMANSPNLKELPTSDCSNSAIVVGAALANKRPIYVIRYQGFGWYNFASILNYAAKSKELWSTPCPLFVRSLGMEGGIGPVAGGMNHSIVCHMPGINVYSPMSPQEYIWVWENFKKGDDPTYCSEHRLSFDREQEFTNIFLEEPAVTVIAIGGARLPCESVVRQRLDCDFYNMVTLKGPKDHLEENGILNEKLRQSIKKSENVLIVDSDMTMCGIGEHLAYEIQKLQSKKINVKILGLRDRTAGFSPDTDNMTPTTTEILNEIKILKKNSQINIVSRCMGG